MHVHQNVESSEIDTWVEKLMSKLTQLLLDKGKHMHCECMHVEKVKSYSPRVLHIVVDLLFTLKL